MSLFKKSNRKFKQRSRQDSDEEDDQFLSLNKKEDQQEDKNLETTIKPSIELKNVKLSFADDEGDNEEIKLKRSSSSLRALKQLGKKAKEARKCKQNELINQMNQANQTKSVRKMMETTKLDNVEDTQQETRIINLDDEDEIEMIEMEDEYLMFKKPATKSDKIPDNKTIEMLKRQRLLAKEQSEYISINRPTASVNEYYESKYESISNSRLVREDPDDKEAVAIDDDNNDLDDDRIDFYSDKTSKQKEKIKEAFFNAQTENEEHSTDNRFKFEDKSSDDELDLWEQSQIKKGVGVQQQKELNTNDFGNLLNDQRNPSKEFDPPAYIKSIRPPLDKNKLINKYKEELHLVERKLDYLHNQFNNIESTINNLKETLNVDA